MENATEHSRHHIDGSAPDEGPRDIEVSTQPPIGCHAFRQSHGRLYSPQLPHYPYQSYFGSVTEAYEQIAGMDNAPSSARKVPWNGTEKYHILREDLESVASENKLPVLLPRQEASRAIYGENSEPVTEPTPLKCVPESPFSATYQNPIQSPEFHTDTRLRSYQEHEFSTKPPQLSHSPLISRWRQGQAYRLKIHRLPDLDPRSDESITKVEQNAEFWVNQLIQAMLNTQNVKDRDASHAKNMFLPGGYDPLLIEATCRELFIYLLDRCRNGFRGPDHFNKALKPARGLEDDKFANCEDRLHNIIRALTWNKRVCKDILYEDWKVRLLVNHPLAYDKEKDSQKGSNDQRRARQKEERERMAKLEEQVRMQGQTGKRKCEKEDGREGDEQAKRLMMGF